MPSVLVGESRRGLVVGWMLGWLIGSLALPTLAHAICCDQPSPQMNANLVCTKNATACVIGPQTIDGPPGCTQPGCDLDFGARPVTFDGAFSVGSGTLKVRALTITINKAIAANGAFAVDLAATGTTCANGVGDLVVRQAIDVSSANAGSIRLTAGCRIGIESTGQLNGNCSTDSSSGGTIDVIAGTSIVQAGTIRATGSGNDGGSVSLRAGDDVQVQKTIDVRSNGDGEGGTITLRAGDPTLTGAAPGGALTVSADLIADGSTDSDGEFGEDGGGITLQASGPVLVTSTAMIRANGGQPDGGGGSLLLLTQELPAGVLTALDGDASLQGPIVMRGAGNGSGGELDGTIGRGLQLAGTVDLSGGGEDSSAGNLVVTTGGDLRVEGPLSLNGRVAASTGGFVDLRAGFAASTATLTVARTIDVSAGSGSDAGDLRLAGCNLAVQPNVLLDARSSLVSFRPAITLAADEALTLGAGSRCLAPPSSATLLVHTATTTVSTAGTTFNPPAVTTIVPPQRSPLPPCPVCGDGIRAPGEPCDPGAGADGACCSNDCLVRVCPTPTHSPTPTVQPTGETPTPTPTVTRTATVTPSPTATVTPGLPPIAPRAVLGCERTLAKGTSRLVTTELAFLENCSLDTLGCLAAGVADPTTCLARVSRRCQSRFTKLVRARQKFDAAFTKRCAGDPPALPFALVRAPDVLAFANLDATCAEDVGLALTSPSAVRACVARAACAGEHALGIAVPHLGTLLARVFDASSAELCFAPGSQDSTPVDVQPSRVAVRCQRAIVTAGRKLLVKQLAVAARCVDSLLGCRLAGGTPSSCAALTEACRRKLAAFQDTTDGTRARLAATIVHACGAVPADQIVLPAGLGFANVGPACLGVGEPAPRDATTIAPCLATVYACASGAIVRRALPLVDGELARVGLALGEHFTCPTVAPSATPTVTPTGATATPTPTPTATPTPTTAPVTLLIPGGGTGTSDCVAEWTVVGRPSDPPSLTTVECVDGDPACDLDGKPDDLCHFAVGVCFANADPQLPECSGVGGLTAYTLQSPQPAASNPIDASNAAALIAVLTDLFGVPPGGLGQNRYTFDPPLVLTAPTNCTAPTSLTVERRGLALRSERIRARAIAGAAGGNVLDDGDNLLLTCVAPGSQPF